MGQVLGLVLLLFFAGQAAPGWAVGPLSGAALNGEKLYTQHCVQCHTSNKPTRAPQLSALKLMGPQDIVDALEIGNMKFSGSLDGSGPTVVGHGVYQFRLWILGRHARECTADVLGGWQGRQ